ncbi:GntR family transcriptional regulator [Aquibium sp. LZ166]|uniref:GntR family transcriptional regulator n=1 Tax=Aquibium pacificus TaxID=3153579 RepID=A0ABV3SPX5_9HYPH
MTGLRVAGTGADSAAVGGPGEDPLRQRDGIPLYLKLASLLREKIRQGQWPAQSQLPTLQDLRGEYGIARETVRQALGVLRGEGLIDSARGRGTFVTAAAEQLGDRAPSYDPLTLGAQVRIEILSRTPCAELPDLDRDLTGMETPLVHVRKRHHAGARPYSLVELWLPQRYFDMLPEGADQTRLYSQLLRDHTGLSGLSGDQVITIMRADIAVARLLGIALSDPVAHLASRLMDPDGCPIMAHRVLIRSDVFAAERRFGDLATGDPGTWRPHMTPPPAPEAGEEPQA